MRHAMFDSLTDLNILEKADELFTDGYNATADFLFGESTSPNGDGGISGSRVVNKGLGYRMKRYAMEALDLPEGMVRIGFFNPPILEYPLGLTDPSKSKGQSSANGPYMTFFAFEYTQDTKGASLRRNTATVSSAATGQFVEGVNQLFTISLPFRGNVKKNVTAELDAVDTFLNKAVSATNDGDTTLSVGELFGLAAAAAGKTIAQRALNSDFTQEALSQASLTTGYAINPSIEMLYKKPERK